MALSPVSLAEWVNADHCPQKALNEAGRLSIELSLAETRVQVGGTDVRWAGAKDYRRSLYRLEVNAASIQCCWQTKQLTEAWDAADPTDLSGVAAWWNSLPLKERPIHEPGCRDPYCEPYGARSASSRLTEHDYACSSGDGRPFRRAGARTSLSIPSCSPGQVASSRRKTICPTSNAISRMYMRP